MPRARRYPVVTWPIPRHTARWRDSEIQYVADWVTRASRATIAQHLGRTPRAVEALQSRRPGLWATQQTCQTARQVAQRCGISHTVMYRRIARGSVRASRLPGGRWWLITEREAHRVVSAAAAPLAPGPSGSGPAA